MHPNCPYPLTSQTSRTALRRAMLREYGPLLSGESLVQALGFRNAAALRQAKRRRRLGVALFTAPHRRGSFALTIDVADWIHGVSADAVKEDAMT